MKKYIQALFFSLLLTATFSTVSFDAQAQGCVMCRAQVGEHKDKDEAKLVGTSLNTGILYLVSIPYLLVATVGFIWWRNNKNSKQQA